MQIPSTVMDGLRIELHIKVSPLGLMRHETKCTNMTVYSTETDSTDCTTIWPIAKRII